MWPWGGRQSQHLQGLSLSVPALLGCPGAFPGHPHWFLSLITLTSLAVIAIVTVPIPGSLLHTEASPGVDGRQSATVSPRLTPLRRFGLRETSPTCLNSLYLLFPPPGTPFLPGLDQGLPGPVRTDAVVLRRAVQVTAEGPSCLSVPFALHGSCVSCWFPFYPCHVTHALNVFQELSTVACVCNPSYLAG